MFVLVGLGNPGKKYDDTRHNIGFNVINVLAETLGIDVNKMKHHSLIGSKFIHGEKIMLVKPQTFMNKSGEAVRDLVNYYDVPLENILIIYDDIDTEIGKIRLRKKGSGGTHNGMTNVIYHLENDEISRLRFGIGKSDTIPLTNYVLGKFEKENIELLNETIIKSKDACLKFINEGIDKAMNGYNG